MTPVVGVLGGTFDPVHLGHLRVAESVRRRTGLPRVLLMPTARPPHKAPDALGPCRDREAMVRLAIEDWDGLELCSLELDEQRVCYTIDSLRALRQGNPPCEPRFILGIDALVEISTWREWQALLQEFDLVLVDRRDRDVTGARAKLPAQVADRIIAAPSSPAPDTAAADRGGRIFHLPFDALPISSSEIRRRAAAGEPLDGLVPWTVAEYIRRTGLYRRRKPAE